MTDFQHDFINVVVIDRNIGEEANRLCREHEDKKLSPCDAIHLACAKKAGCDVLLSWDEGLNSITDPSIRIERPVLQEIPEGPLTEGTVTVDERQGTLFEEEKQEGVNESKKEAKRAIRLVEFEETDETTA